MGKKDLKRITSLSEAISIASRHWKISLKEKNREEACGPCPWCGGKDRFLVFHTGYYLCVRKELGHCGREGWILDEVLGDIKHRLSALEIQQLRQQAKAAEEKREREKLAERVAALEKMAKCTDHIAYHRAVDRIRDYWHAEGLNDEAIDRWMLGYCANCPTDFHHRESATTPIINRRVLRGIDHRILSGEKHDKYRPHMKGLGNRLFYADSLLKPDKSMIMLWEGAKKAMVNAQYGFDGPAVMGMQKFQEAWAKWFMRFDAVYVCYDPDAIEKAAQVASLFDGKGMVVELPMKADDIWGIGMTKREMCEFLRKARAV